MVSRSADRSGAGMAGAVYSVSASRGKTLWPMLGLLICAGVFLFAASRYWDFWPIAGVLLALALVMAIGAVILAYRVLSRPVMLRVDADGIYLARLAVTIPWQALARIERVSVRGETVHSLVEAEGGHPVFDERGLLLGAAVNQRLGLPPLAISMSTLDGSAEALEAAILGFGRVPIVDTPEAQAQAGT